MSTTTNVAEEEDWVDKTEAAEREEEIISRRRQEETDDAGRGNDDDDDTTTGAGAAEAAAATTTTPKTSLDETKFTRRVNVVGATSIVGGVVTAAGNEDPLIKRKLGVGGAANVEESEAAALISDLHDSLTRKLIGSLITTTTQKEDSEAAAAALVKSDSTHLSLSKREPNADLAIQKAIRKRSSPPRRCCPSIGHQEAQTLQPVVRMNGSALGTSVSDVSPFPAPPALTRRTEGPREPGAYPRAGIDGARRQSSDGTIHIGVSSRELLAMAADAQQQQQQQQQSPSPGVMESRQRLPQPVNEETAPFDSNDQSGGLVEAQLVTPSKEFLPEDLEAAEPVVLEESSNNNENNTPNSSSKQQWHLKTGVMIVSFLGVIVLVVVVLVVTTTTTASSSSSSESSSSSSSSPEDGPSPPVSTTPAIPTLAPTLMMEPTFAILPEISQAAIYQNPDSSPQAMAYQWLLEDPNLSKYTPQRVLQRFALATFFYATKGGDEEWFEIGGGEEPILVTGKEPDDGPKGPPGGRDPGPSCSDKPFRPGGPKPPADNGNSSVVAMGPTYVNSSAWLSYDSHECYWFSSSMALTGSTRSMCGDSNTNNFAVVNLHLQQNNLQGTLPPQLGLLTSLTALSLDVNHMTGFLPSQLGVLTNLHTLRLSKNKLSGSVPTQVGQLSQLKEFGLLRNNGFTGTLPGEFWNRLSNLQVLQMGPHNNAGTLPNNVGQLMPDLTVFMGGFSGFTGSIPTSLGLLTKLEALDLNQGSITGTIPTQLSQLVNTERIFLARNQLTGSLPSELGSSLLTSLGAIWVDGNTQLGGTIPSEFSSLQKLQDFKIADTAIEGSIPEELCNIGWMGFECSDILCGCSCCPCE